MEWKAFRAYTNKLYGNGSRPEDLVPSTSSVGASYRAQFFCAFFTYSRGQAQRGSVANAKHKLLILIDFFSIIKFGV